MRSQKEAFLNFEKLFLNLVKHLPLIFPLLPYFLTSLLITPFLLSSRFYKSPLNSMNGLIMTPSIVYVTRSLLCVVKCERLSSRGTMTPIQLLRVEVWSPSLSTVGGLHCKVCRKDLH